MRFKVVAVSGSVSSPSKTEVLIQTIIDQFKETQEIDVHFVKLSTIGRDLSGALFRSELPTHIKDDLTVIENADLLIVGTPVYRASFTGLFKHLFDFVDQNALIDVPILLSASGGSHRHALILEHQLRPLFSFFQAHTLPIGVYAIDNDFKNYQVTSSALDNRIQLAVQRALPFLNHQKTKKIGLKVLEA